MRRMPGEGWFISCPLNGSFLYRQFISCLEVRMSNLMGGKSLALHYTISLMITWKGFTFTGFSFTIKSALNIHWFTEGDPDTSVIRSKLSVEYIYLIEVISQQQVTNNKSELFINITTFTEPNDHYKSSKKQLLNIFLEYQ